jgi:plasmid stability protein
MAAITIRNLTDETHRALKARAAAHGVSTEAEVRQILNDAVAGRMDVGFGSRIVMAVAEVGGIDLDIQRDQTPVEPITFE